MYLSLQNVFFRNKPTHTTKMCTLVFVSWYLCVLHSMEECAVRKSYNIGLILMTAFNRFRKYVTRGTFIMI